MTFYVYPYTSIFTPISLREKGGGQISPHGATVFDVCFSAPSETAPHACRATHRVYTGGFGNLHEPPHFRGAVPLGTWWYYCFYSMYDIPEMC